MKPEAFGGGELSGDRIVRIAYLDEAGISNQSHEPIAVVAGVIVHADQQWLTVQKALDDIAAKYIADASKRSDLIFHAAELFSGGKFFNREEWPLEVRLNILEDIVRLVPDYGLQVVAGHRDRNEAQARGRYNRTDIAHLSGFIECLHGIEQWMLNQSLDEVCMVVVEDSSGMKSKYRRIHQKIRRGGKMYRDRYLLPPLTKIIDTVHTAEKNQSTILQLADACAFIIKRGLMGKPHMDRFLRHVQPFRPTFFEC